MKPRSSSRLDSAIARLMTLRACLDWATAETAKRPGLVMEFGLGNGRSYDHLRRLLPGRDIHVFDRQVDAHPDCIPPPDRLWLGDFRDTAPAAARRSPGQVALVHGDVGSGDDAGSLELALWLAPHWAALLQDGGLLVSDQPISSQDFVALPLPGGEADRYFLFRRNRR